MADYWILRGFHNSIPRMLFITNTKYGDTFPLMLKFWCCHDRATVFIFIYCAYPTLFKLASAYVHDSFTIHSYKILLLWMTLRIAFSISLIFPSKILSNSFLSPLSTSHTATWEMLPSTKLIIFWHSSRQPLSTTSSLEL